MNHRSDIDGLRAVAVIPVLLYHGGFGFTGGYVGVDVFFVISGFLITGLILKEIDQDRFSLADFWERRVRRILPPLTVVLLSSLIIGAFLLLASDFKALGESALAQAALVSNIYFWRDSGYFAPASEMKPLLHTWSLAVEEQFYLFFPLLLVAIRRYSRSLMLPVLFLLFIASFVLSVYATEKYPSAAFYLLPPRAWELMLGSLLAAGKLRAPRAQWLTELCSVTGFLAILIAVFTYDHGTKFPGIGALLPCFGTALLIWANTKEQKSHIANFLSTRPVVFIGLISYSLYLWHWPLLVFSGYWALDGVTVTSRVLALIGSFVLATLSWKFIETPFRKRVVLKSRKNILSFAVVSILAVAVMGLSVTLGGGLPVRWPRNVRDIQGYTPDDIAWRFNFANLTARQVQDGALVELGTRDKSQKPGLLLWGDSHAMALMSAIDVMAKENSIRGVGAMHFAWAPLLEVDSEVHGEEQIFERSVVEMVAKQNIKDVLLVARWSSYLKGTASTDTQSARIVRTIASLNNAGARVWILKQVPAHQGNLAKRMVSAVLANRDPNKVGLTLREFREESAGEEALFKGLSGANYRVLDPVDLFTDENGYCRVVENGQALYFDGDHLTDRGALVLRPILEPMFAAIRSGQPAGSAGYRQ